MSDDLVSRLRQDAVEIAGWGAGNEAKRVEEAAQALTEARAEIERLRAGINGVVNFQSGMTRSQVRESCAEILGNKTVGLNNQSPFAAALGDWKVRATTMEISVKEAARSIHNLMTRAIAAESELSTLRARVREVVGLGLDVISEERGWGTYSRMEGSEIYTDADVFSRAARQLNEDLK